MMSIYKNKGRSSSKIYDRPMLGFRNSEMVRGISNDLFPLVIMTIIGQFGVSQILIDRRSSRDTLYSPLFEKMGLDRGSLIPYDDSNLQEFNETTTHP